MKGKHCIHFALCLWLSLITAVLAIARAKPAAERREVQRHGYVFEKWVRDTFFDGYQLASYTQIWDVPKDKNKKYGGVPVQVKMTKYGAPVDLSDALRQFQISEEFLLIIGYWQQDGERKRLVNIVAATVPPKLWQSLWQPIALDDLKKLDAVVKNRALDYKTARAEAKKIKAGVPFSKAVITVNPKIDPKSQRRLQCSLRFHYVFERLAPKADPRPQEKPALFGVPAPEPFVSAPRRTRKK